MLRLLKSLCLSALCVACITLSLTACMDDETFSTSPSDMLSFSTDTVKLDTCFSKVPTVTKTFWVHNNTGKAIRCSSIRLNGGNQTGYRINVNGIYLGSSRGYVLTDEEILKGDSLRVFVELTSPMNGGDKPVLVTDDIVFELESGVTQKVNLRAYSWDADLLKDIVLTNDSTLSGDRPTVIYGGIKVPEGKTLRIAAGKTVYLHDSAYLNIYGTLECQGERGKEVILRGDRLDNMFDYLKYDGVSGQWGGIHFYPTSYGNKITYTDIHAATDAVVCDSSDVARKKLTVSHSTIHNNKGYGVLSTNADVAIDNCQITNTLGSCVEIRGGKAKIDYCTLAQFYPFDYDRGAALAFSNGYDDKKYDLKAIDITNSIITGYADDVLTGTQVDTTKEFNYSFDHCLVRTPDIDSTHCEEMIFETPKDSCQGTDLFEKIDTELLQYDFHLSDKAPAIGRAKPITSLPDDREGTLRDEKPSMGCFEKKTESKN